ncbi:MAG: hypothetical protein GWP07_07720, partial [Xanthomonadaceae bacterium]|nr:hypothetical protein [Xanthomonadaceae bacterium]
MPITSALSFVMALKKLHLNFLSYKKTAEKIISSGYFGMAFAHSRCTSCAAPRCSP